MDHVANLNAGKAPLFEPGPVLGVDRDQRPGLLHRVEGERSRGLRPAQRKFQSGQFARDGESAAANLLVGLGIGNPVEHLALLPLRGNGVFVVPHRLERAGNPAEGVGQLERVFRLGGHDALPDIALLQ